LIQSIEIPQQVESFGSSCFSDCKSLSSISFELPSSLTRIESKAFYHSSLQSIVIPRSVQFIDGSAFIGLTLSSISIETGNDIFVIENDFLIDIVDHKLIRNFSNSSEILIPWNIEILGSSSFSSCASLSSISFSSNCRLTRIESSAFSYSSLQSIAIPHSVQILGSSCFSSCRLLSSISFDYPSQLKRIESRAFDPVDFTIVIPSTISFLAFDATLNPLQLSFPDENSCPEFDRWRQLRSSGISVDFRRIQRVDSALDCLKEHAIDLSVFEEESELQRSTDGIKVIMTSIHLSASLENEVNLQHFCIISPLGFVFPVNSVESQELKIVRLHSENNSLAEVLSISPMWWTSTVKAKAIVGIVIGLRFAHSFGLLHGNLNSKNVLFDVDHRIQITNFSSLCLNQKDEWNWTPKVDINAFASLLFDVMVHPSTTTENRVNMPEFVSDIIEEGLSTNSRKIQSFWDIFEILKKYDFKIEDDVDSAELSAYINEIECIEQSEE
jgi:hypothetical protein